MEVITTHVNADFDTIASMVAARKLYPGAVIVLPGTQEETVKGFLIQSAFYALEVRKAREIDLSRVITHRLGLEDAPGAYQTFRDKADSCIKVVLKPGDHGHFHAHGGNGREH